MIGFKKALGVATVVTALEDIGLIVWLFLLQVQDPYASTVYAAAVVVLLGALLFEHLYMQNAENPALTLSVADKTLSFTILEVFNWSIWIILVNANLYLIALPYFLVGFFVEHQITENVIRGRPFLSFHNSNHFVTLAVIIETLSEAVGAGLWITSGTVGIVFLVIGSFFEHLVQYVAGRIPNP